jgi:hypothetical protein
VTRQPEVRHYLCGMDRNEALYSFDLDDEPFLDDEIKAITTLEARSLVDDGKRNLSSKPTIA